MFCPKCGVNNPDSAEFCGGCGHRFNIADTVPEDTEAKRDEAPEASSDGSVKSTETKKSIFKRFFKSKPRKLAAILLAIAILACSVVGIGTAIRSCVIKEHATGYVLRSYVIFLDNAAKKSEFCQVLKKADKNFTAKAHITEGKIKYSLLTLADINGDALFSYDKSKNRYFLSLNGKIDGSRIGITTDTGVKAYTDFENINLDFHAKMGDEKIEGSYYAPMTDIKKNIIGSIFDPAGENVQNITDDKLDRFVNNYETAYNFIEDDKLKNVLEDEDKLMSLERILNTHSNPKVESGRINVFGRDVDCDIVTQTITRKESVGLYRDLMNVVISTAKESGFDTTEIKSKRDRDIKSMNKELDSNPEKASDKLVLTHYINKSSGEIAKCVIEGHYSDRRDEKTTVEFTNDGETAVRSSTVKDDSTDTSEFRRVENGDEVVDTYKKNDVAKFELRYNKSTKEFTMSAGDKNYKGTAEIDGDEININCSVDLSPTINVPSLLGVSPTGYIKFEVNIKPESEITPFKGKNNFYDISADTFKAQFKNSTKQPLL